MFNKIVDAVERAYPAENKAALGISAFLGLTLFVVNILTAAHVKIPYAPWINIGLIAGGGLAAMGAGAYTNRVGIAREISLFLPPIILSLIGFARPASMPNMAIGIFGGQLFSLLYFYEYIHDREDSVIVTNLDSAKDQPPTSPGPKSIVTPSGDLRED